MKIEINQIEHQLRNAAAKYVSQDEAAYFADLSLESHLRKSPRMNPLGDALADLKIWAAAKHQTLKVEVDKESILLLDFDGLAPALRIKYVHDELERRARKNGMSAVGFRNSSAIVTLNPWSQGLARRDLIGITLFNGGTGCCVPFGGTRGIFGTLPLSYAIPTADRPIILDMATTEIPFFQIKQSKDKGIALPEGAAVDHRGLPTIDAAAALDRDGVANLLPIGGGFKGYGLVMLLEIMTGALVRSLLSTEQTPGWNPPEYGGLVCAIDIAGFTDPGRFKKEVSAMCAELRRQTPVQGREAVVIPGDRGHRKSAAARKSGEIEIDPSLAEELAALAL